MGSTGGAGTGPGNGDGGSTGPGRIAAIALAIVAEAVRDFGAAFAVMRTSPISPDPRPVVPDDLPPRPSGFRTPAPAVVVAAGAGSAPRSGGSG
jgi:hypothetical protein